MMGLLKRIGLSAVQGRQGRQVIRCFVSTLERLSGADDVGEWR